MQDSAVQNLRSASASKGGLPRAVDVTVSIAALILFLPVLVGAGAAVRISSPGRIIFRQERIGVGGRRFVIYKLRTMHPSNEAATVATHRDARIFAVGRFLRRTKIDELPGFWNVVRGDMALVGPRPELPRYVDHDDPLWRRVLADKPGLTHPVTLQFSTEEKILGSTTGDPEDVYRHTLLPLKLRSYIEYSNSRTWNSDVSVLIETAFTMLRSIIRPAHEKHISLPQQ